MSFMSSRGFIWIVLLAATAYTCLANMPGELLIRAVTILYTLYYFSWAQSECIKNDPTYMLKLYEKVEATQQKYAKKCADKIYKQEIDSNVRNE